MSLSRAAVKVVEAAAIGVAGTPMAVTATTLATAEWLPEARGLTSSVSRQCDRSRG